MFDDIIIRDILSVINIYSKKGNYDTNTKRKCYGLSFCKSGKITYIQNGVKYVSDSKSAVIIPKGGTYKILRQETGYFPVINFECDNFHTDKFLVIPVNNYQTLYKLFNELSEHFYYKEKLEAKSVLYRLLAEIAKGSKGDNASRAVSYIYENLSNPALNNKEIADYLKISETYLNKQFLKDNGTTPKKFIQKARIEKAIKLLSEDGNAINEIAEMCGFSSIYSFSRAFKNYMQKSPSEYKNEIRKNII